MTNQEALRDITHALTDRLGNLEPVLNVYPDRPAPVLRNNVGFLTNDAGLKPRPCNARCPMTG